MDIIGFYINALGYSHLSSQKPCQDSGRYFAADNVYISVVCDGHGGSSYVRSDIGAQIAADVVVEKIQAFIRRIPNNLFENKKGAVTVKPTRDPIVDENGKRRDISALSESEIELLRQLKSYIQESQKYPDIEKAFREMFSEICIEWKNRVVQDADVHPFTKAEKEKNGSKRIEKAYGTTLMAAVRTTDYWFAFHIGDGKLYACDDLMQWTEPVPWDCNCFMNTTTSLCGHFPANDFRYAFDGTGNFPIAFALGSDGIDDTFLHSDLIHKFYSQILCVFNERNPKEAEELLKVHLAELSKRGSHDDMSVATIIDRDKLDTAIQYYKIISEVRNINAKRDSLKEELEQLQVKRDKLSEDIDNKCNSCNKKAEETKKWWRAQLDELFKKRESYKSSVDEVKNSQSKLAELNQIIAKKEESFSDWIELNREHVSELKEEACKITKTVSRTLKSVSVLVEKGHEEKSDPVCTSNITVSGDKKENIAGEDSPNEVYVKANEAMMSQEGIARMEKESEVQIKELLNKKK